MLGEPGLGYPPSLYPNFTYISTADVDPTDNSSNFTAVYAFGDFLMNQSSTLLLGPLQINSSFALVSLTLPIINNTSAVDILGYMTLV